MDHTHRIDGESAGKENALNEVLVTYLPKIEPSRGIPDGGLHVENAGPED